MCVGMSESKDCWLSIAAFHTQSNACVHKYVWVGACVCERERERERERVQACVGFSAGREGDRETGKEFTFNHSCSYKRSFVKQCRKTDVQWLLTKRGNNNK